MNKVFKLYVMPGGSKASDESRGTNLWLPATPYELLDIWNRLGLSADEPVWLNVINTAVRKFPCLPLVDETDRSRDDLCALNHLAQKLSEFNDADRLAFAGLLRLEEAQQEKPPDIPRLIDLAYSIECCHMAPSVVTDEQLGKFVVEYGLDAKLEELPDEVLDRLHCKGLLNYSEIGQQHRLAENGIFVHEAGRGICGYVERYMDVKEVSKQLDLHMKEPDYTVLLRMPNGREVKLPTREPLPGGSFTCLDCKIPALKHMIGHERDMAAMDRFALTLEDLTAKELSVCKSVIEAKACRTLEQVTDVIWHVDEYILSPNQRTPADYAKEMLSVILNSREAKELMPFVNLYRYGEALMQRLHCTATEYGIVERNDGQPLVQVEEEPDEMAGMEGMV